MATCSNSSKLNEDKFVVQVDAEQIFESDADSTDIMDDNFNEVSDEVSLIKPDANQRKYLCQIDINWQSIIGLILMMISLGLLGSVSNGCIVVFLVGYLFLIHGILLQVTSDINDCAQFKTNIIFILNINVGILGFITSVRLSKICEFTFDFHIF